MVPFRKIAAFAAVLSSVSAYAAGLPVPMAGTSFRAEADAVVATSSGGSVGIALPGASRGEWWDLRSAAPSVPYVQFLAVGSDRRPVAAATVQPFPGGPFEIPLSAPEGDFIPVFLPSGSVRFPLTAPFRPSIADRAAAFLKPLPVLPSSINLTSPYPFPGMSFSGWLALFGSAFALLAWAKRGRRAALAVVACAWTAYGARAGLDAVASTGSMATAWWFPPAESRSYLDLGHIWSVGDAAVSALPTNAPVALCVPGWPYTNNLEYRFAPVPTVPCDHMPQAAAVLAFGVPVAPSASGSLVVGAAPLDPKFVRGQRVGEAILFLP